MDRGEWSVSDTGRSLWKGVASAWLPQPCGPCQGGRCSPWAGLTLRSGLEAAAPSCANVVLGGRATSVPFTAVLNGPERTTTDNHEAASTCAVPILAGAQQRPIWFWEQEVTPVAVPTRLNGFRPRGVNAMFASH
jgi:hypothetical protein